ncbi:serine/threonine protein kinase [bacterium]|nr:serine/threonine protein kinase [bacterium]
MRSRSQSETFRTLVTQFIEEAQNLARLTHPNIVRVHQVFEDNNTAYMAMDFIEGSDLLEVAESTAAFDPDTLERIVIKLLDAIEFIHNEDVIHRDISPDNILLSKSDEPVLIDFGAATAPASANTELLSAIRTVKDGYSPQEFYISDGDHFPSSDLYCFAASLYYVMTKELPIGAQLRLTTIADGDTDPYVPIKGRVEGYSAPFLDAIDQALALFPKNRIQSAAEWRAMITETKVVPITRGVVSQPTPDAQPAQATKDDPHGQDAKITGRQPSLSATRRQISELVSENTAASSITKPSLKPGKRAPSKARYFGSVAATLVTLGVIAAFVIFAFDDDDNVEIPSNEQAATDTSSPAPTGAPAPEPEPEPEPEVATLNTSPVDTGKVLKFSVAADASDPTRVASVEGPLAEHLQPGFRLISVNGLPVQSLNNLQRSVEVGSDQSVGSTVQVTLEIEDPAQGNTFERSVALPVVERTTLLNGVSFETTIDDGSWKSVVVTGIGTDQADLQTGDQIIAFMPDNELIDSEDALARALLREIQNGTAEVLFAVKRDDEMWLVTMPVATNAEN